jgi:capsular polysaccharide biosynthesis protein
VRQVADYIRYRLGVYTEKPVEPDSVVIFSRKSNRLLMNEDEIKDRLAKELNFRGQYLRMEDASFEEQVAILQRAKVAIGMHGRYTLFLRV